MSDFIAALPMYDWPEVQSETDAHWAVLREELLRQGIDAPERLVRRNADMPAVPGGIRDAAGAVIASDPATLPPDELDLHTLWRHPRLLFAQTCWGPMEMGLSAHVRVVGQPDYSEFQGGEGEFYSSAVLMRWADFAETQLSEGGTSRHDAPDGAKPDKAGASSLPLDLLRGARLAFNSGDSMSGVIALKRDLEAMGGGLHIFRERIETGGHRASIIAVADGRADVCAIDCRTWDLARRFEPKVAELRVVGWTARRKGLPYIAGLKAPVFSLRF
ncbi:ABC-type phosphate/phosphonate transport system substrate-binding protein [Mesorhizobium sp. J18]|uniref:PhnD/SsuA/transferrin family substrate-binding protein n=1 Tax=Mesorhizobium sp. J18 TaxID=935263 RepID=UPI00119C406B|nr:PhnD/SsuA/transferrin family substrate-binding protein [Mesorhizobium sp. J18]TWH01142.1 ABC-type phosphate/phosphonate transport system substrate-binding protein [Mesorhizobium sp. J18]